jgi:hypothetical protein
MKILSSAQSNLVKHGWVTIQDVCVGPWFARSTRLKLFPLCDKQAAGFLNQTQMIEWTLVTVRRIPVVATSNKQRLAWTQGVSKGSSTYWLSHTTCSYSFHPKGLPLFGCLILKRFQRSASIAYHVSWGLGWNFSNFSLLNIK